MQYRLIIVYRIAPALVCIHKLEFSARPEFFPDFSRNPTFAARSHNRIISEWNLISIN
jgi:hypothetical protein